MSLVGGIYCAAVSSFAALRMRRPPCGERGDAIPSLLSPSLADIDPFHEVRRILFQLVTGHLHGAVVAASRREHRLKPLQGHIQVHFHVFRQGGRAVTGSEETEVIFRPASEKELLAYIATGEPMDKAGAYGIQGKGSLLVEGIRGDFFNVMGLPLLRLSRMLEQFGITLW